MRHSLSKIAVSAANLDEDLLSTTVVIAAPARDDPLVRRAILSEREAIVEGWKLYEYPLCADRRSDSYVPFISIGFMRSRICAMFTGGRAAESSVLDKCPFAWIRLYCRR